MKKYCNYSFRFFLMVFILNLYTLIKSEAQSTDKYYVFQYHQVHPSNESEYIQLEFDVWKKMHHARINQGVLEGWYFYRVIAPAGMRNEYNFVVVLVYKDTDQLGRHFEEYGVDYTQILTAEEIRKALNTPNVRDLVYEEVWRSVDEIMDFSRGSMFRYQVFNTMRIRSGYTNNEYTGLETRYWKPVHQARISGGKMRGWGLYNMIIPGGTERDYQFATVDYYDRFIQFLDDSSPIISKFHGSRNLDKITIETIDTRDLMKTEVRELLDFLVNYNIH